MLYRILSAALVLGTAVTVLAQSHPCRDRGFPAACPDVNFELNTDSFSAQGGGVATGDFNNDGKPDMVQCCGTGSSGGAALEFRAGNGDGSFQSAVTAASSPVALYGMVAADFNGDGYVDVAGVPGPGGSGLYVWYGNGNGTFQAPIVYATTQAPISLAAGNFFGNGRSDLAVGESEGAIDLFRNDGGQFALDQSIALPGSSPVQLDAGDLNGTGVSDIAAALAYGASPSAVYVLWNSGKGSFTQDSLGAYVQPLVKVARLNGIAQMDVLVGYTCNPTPNSSPKGSGYTPCAGFDVYYGQGGNLLYKRTVITDPNVYGPGAFEGLAVWGVDVNGDGYGDIVASTATDCWCQFGLFVWEGNADGSFQQTAQAFIANTEDGAGLMAAADFNRDGMMDFVVDGVANSTARFYLNATKRAACGTYTISPSVTACQPVDNTYSPSPVRVQATSYDTINVTAMQEYVDYQLEYSQPVTSFNTTFSEPLGPHFFVTKGWDASGRNFMADRTVTVYDGTPGPVCAADQNSASICLPSEPTSGSPVLILANGNTGLQVPTAAQLYIDGNLVINNEGACLSNGYCSGGTSYIQTSQNLSTGEHSLVFKLWDARGDVYTATKTITVD